MTSAAKDCRFCGVQRPRRATHCPHCGQPQDFPNVEDANAPNEVTALQNRYDNAYRNATARRCDAKLQEFETAVAGRSRAIFACPLTKLMPLATGQHDLYAPYYRLAELRLPKGPPAGEPKWEVIRPVVETALFGDQFKRDVHYAALTLDG